LQTVYHNAYHNDPYAKEFGIRISEKLASVEARILPPPWVNSLCFLSLSPKYTLHILVAIVYWLMPVCLCSSSIMIQAGRKIVFLKLGSGT
jgi:hypothetical protein